MTRARHYLTEAEIISSIARLKCTAKNTLPGDDIARFQTGRITYAGSDSLIQGVHYRDRWLKPRELAYKLFARNWSDFICKGIRPRYALLNLNLKPPSAVREFIWPFLAELDTLMARYGVTLVGGDTARAPADVFTLTFLGTSGKFIPRENAAIGPGDAIVQIGAVGGSDLARRLLAGKKACPAGIRAYFARPQLLPALPHARVFKAALDQSDSVAKTIAILAGQNHLALEIDLGHLALSHKRVRGTRNILNAAEDLAVFGIVAPRHATAFRVIGYVKSIRLKRPGVVYRHRGKIVSYAASGFEHF